VAPVNFPFRYGDRKAAPRGPRDEDLPYLSASIKVGEPAWRRLEQRLEQKRTAELISDLEDYDIGLANEPPSSNAAHGKVRRR